MTTPQSAPDPRLLGDMPAEELLRHGRAVLERIASYLAEPEQWPVLPAVRPGDMVAALPTAPPATGEPFEEILNDFDAQALAVVALATTIWRRSAAAMRCLMPAVPCSVPAPGSASRA